MSVTTTCRDLSELADNAELACRLLFQECYKAGIREIFITETYRSQARQNYLYEQGRSRKGNKVTWTKSSRHTSRLAWDIAVSNGNLYDIRILTRVGIIAGKLGITWGGNWKDNVDMPHFEVTKNWKMPKGYKLEGQVVVPSNSKLKVQLNISDTSNKVKLDEDKREQGGVKMLKDSTSPHLKQEFIALLEDGLAKGYISDKKWVEQAKAGTMTLADATLLLMRINERRGA